MDGVHPRIYLCVKGCKMTVSATDANFEEEVLKSDLPVLVDFWADWCGPCKMIAPVLEELSGELSGKLKIVKVDVDASPGIATKYVIQSIPTLMLFKDGEMVDRQMGALPRARILSWLDTTVSVS